MDSGWKQNRRLLFDVRMFAFDGFTGDPEELEMVMLPTGVPNAIPAFNWHASRDRANLVKVKSKIMIENDDRSCG